MRVTLDDLQGSPQIQGNGHSVDQTSESATLRHCSPVPGPNRIRSRVCSRPRFRQTFQPFLGPGDSKKYDRTQTRTIAFLKAFTRRDRDSAPIRFGPALQSDRDDAPPERPAKIETGLVRYGSAQPEALSLC